MRDDEQQAVTIARQTIDVVPRLMALMSKEARNADLGAVANHIGVLHMLQQRVLTLSALAELMEVSSASMTNTVTTLEGRGWVRRVRDERDRRLVHVALTPEGQAACNAIEDRVAGRMASFFAQFNAEQQQLIMQTFALVTAAFDALDAPDSH